jgi:murein DD-endopeptidase MepM/ murein hydrolase activator NlpD
MPNLLQPAFSLAQSASAGNLRLRPRRRPAAPISLGRRAILIWGAILVVLLAWSAASTSYVLFRDRVLRDIRHHYSLAARTASARNAELRLQVDHLKAARMTDRAKFGDEIDRLAKRQALLEHRAAALHGLNTGAKPYSEKLTARAAPVPVPPPPPVTDTVVLASPHQPPRLSRAALPGLPTVAVSAGLPQPNHLAMLSRAYDTVEASQSAALAQFERKLDRQLDKLRAIYRHVGVATPPPGKAAADVGGPYIPIAASPLGGDTAFDRTLARVISARLDVQRLRNGLVHVPVRAPLPELIETSGFGAREDPFNSTLAFHPGIDLRAGAGSKVRATAAGKVTVASWTGGYGNMVEIDHGGGLRTRYGHLSKIEVKVGEEIAAGEEIGRTGSTGRSTGPHLHYEVRVDGAAIDPMTWIKAGRQLAPLLAANAPS